MSEITTTFLIVVLILWAIAGGLFSIHLLYRIHRLETISAREDDLHLLIERLGLEYKDVPPKRVIVSSKVTGEREVSP